MDSRRRGKRKSPSQDIIFEVSDDDISPEPSDNDCNEPDAKILKTDEDIFHLVSSSDSNLENDKQNINPKNSPDGEKEDDSILVIDANSLSDNSAIGFFSCADNVIDITADDSCTPNLEVELCPKPVEDPVNVELIVSIDTEKPICSPLKEGDFNLEEGELEEITNTEINKSNFQSDDLDSSKCTPCICITFRDDDIAELYKTKFLKFVQTFVELEVKNFEGLTINIDRDCTLNPGEWVVLDETICITDVKQQAKDDNLADPNSSLEKSPSKKKKKRKNKKEKELFILDTNPSIDENNGSCTKYSSKFQIDSEKSMPEEQEIRISAQVCFNCDGSHAIKDCTLPKNFAKINAARQRWKAQKQTSRYHLEEDQKYGHLVPGKISDKLREALGLRNNQLPPFIYLMRTLGYPPGWLEEAKFLHSNLEMFDSEGNNVRGGIRMKQGLDPEKIVSYPGFNSAMPEEIKDEYRQYRVPPFSEKCSKQAMIEFFEKQYAKEQDNFEACDMDLDATFEENKEQVAEIKEDAPVLNPVLSELKDVDRNISSPSLTDLETVKENLLAALEDNSSCNPKSVETTGKELVKSECEVTSDVQKSQASKVSVDKNLVIDIEKAEDSNASVSSPPQTGNANSVKTSMFGTPILKSNSPYSRLPNPDNFMKDVSPVINFENLPNSTGKYEQMTEVLQKVRSTLRKNLQDCES